MRTYPEHEGLMLDLSNQREQAFATHWIGPALLKILCQAAGPFYGKKIDYSEAGLGNFGTKFLWPMKERSREIFWLACRIPVLAILKIAFENRHEERVVNKTTYKRIEKRPKPANGSREKEPSWTKDASSLTKRPKPVASLHQVIKRPKQQDPVDRLLRAAESLCVADLSRGNPGGPSRCCNVRGDNIQEMRLVSERTEPSAVDPGASADVENSSGCGRKVAQNQFAGALKFKLPPAGAKSRVFWHGSIVRDNVGHAA
jgi:hypothetical protein